MKSETSTRKQLIKKLKAQSPYQNAYNKIHIPQKNGTDLVVCPTSCSTSELCDHLKNGAHIC